MDLTPPNISNLDDVKVYLERMYQFIKWWGNLQVQYMEWQEVDAPEAPESGRFRIVATRSDDGRTQFIAKFNSGDVLVAIEEFTTDDLSEGSSNLFYTSSRINELLNTVSDLILGDLTSSRIVVANTSGTLESGDLADWITGTANQITVTDDNDGSVTLSTPQDLATTSGPTFDHLHVSTAYHAYGGFQSKSQTVTCSVQNTWYHITNGTNDLWTGTEAQGMSLSGDVLTITNAGDYSGSLSMTLSGLTGKDFHIRVYNITQTAQAGYIQGISTTGATNFANVTLPLYIEANAGDTFRMEVQCTTAAVGNPIFEHAVFYLQYLHD